MNEEFEAELQKLARSHALLNAADKVVQLTRERDALAARCKELEQLLAAAAKAYVEWSHNRGGFPSDELIEALSALVPVHQRTEGEA